MEGVEMGSSGSTGGGVSRIGCGGARGRANVRRGLGLLAACAVLATTAAFAPTRPGRQAARIVTPQIPARASAMLEAALRAVSQHRAKAMSPFVAGSIESFRWVESEAHQWKADVLPVPGDAAKAPIYLAVFHTFHTCESDGDHVYRLLSDAPDSRAAEDGGATWKLGEEVLETETLGLRIRDHAIYVSLSLGDRTLTLHDAVTLERSPVGHAGEPSSAYGLLRINDGYRIRSFGVSGVEGESPYKQAGGVVAFVPSEADRFTLTLDYSGSPDHGNGDFIHDDEAVIASYWYPHIARLPATLTLTATAPPGWTPIGQGEPVLAKVNADGSRTMAWRNDIPTSYFTLDMGRYQIVNRHWRGRLLSAYLLEPPGDFAAQAARQSLDRLQESLAYFETAFGPFPYTRYALVETLGPFNGALEAYSFATFGPRTLPEFIPHEVSHTWWGGLLPCTYMRSMWNEAFASYSDDLFQRSSAASRPGQAAVTAAVNRRREDRKRGLRWYEGATVGRACDTENEVDNAVGYEKGAQVLRVLEDQLGRARMLASIRVFVSDHKRGAPAEWEEFEAAVARTTGEDMRWFFAQWLERAGTPKLAVSDIRVRPDGGGRLITGHIRQDAPLYRVKLPIVVELRSGRVVRDTVEIRGGDTSFSLRVAGVPDRLHVDPEATIPFAAAAVGASQRGDPFTREFP